MLKRDWFLPVVLLGVFSTAASPVLAQDPVIDAGGFQQHREYISQMSYEHVDMMTGALVLTFTEVDLPGGPGIGLQFQRTYNSTVRPPYTAWSYGLAGLPMSISGRPGRTRDSRSSGSPASA